MAAALVAERELVEDALRDRAAVGSRQQALALEQVEVTADGGGRYAQLVRDVGDVHAAVPGQPLQDRLQPLRLPHRNRSSGSGQAPGGEGSGQASASPDLASKRCTSSSDIPRVIVAHRGLTACVEPGDDDRPLGGKRFDPGAGGGGARRGDRGCSVDDRLVAEQLHDLHAHLHGVLSGGARHEAQGLPAARR